MKPEDFATMKWRIDTLTKDQSCLDEYPDLAETLKGKLNEPILTTITNEQLVRYIIYAYHKGSPFVRQTREVKHRKNQALKQAGCENFNEEILGLVNNTNESVPKLILTFLIRENDMKFSALMMQTDAYYKYNYELAYTDAKSVKSLTQAISDLEASIESLSHEVFSGDRDLVNFLASSKDYVLSPEQFAHKK